MENKSIRTRLYQTLGQKSPKHPFLLQEVNGQDGPILKPKKMQDSTTNLNRKTSPIYQHGKLLLSPTANTELPKKKPIAVQQ